MAKIFIGSSRESLSLVGEIHAWLEDLDLSLEVLRWDDPEAFTPGKYIYDRLVEISREVDAAMLVFSEDDQVWYRNDQVTQPRANVFIEYGLFSGVLGSERAVICRDGNPETAGDLDGLIYIDVSEGRKANARLRLEIWARKVGEAPPFWNSAGRLLAEPWKLIAKTSSTVLADGLRASQSTISGRPLEALETLIKSGGTLAREGVAATRRTLGNSHDLLESGIAVAKRIQAIIEGYLTPEEKTEEKAEEKAEERLKKKRPN